MKKLQRRQQQNNANDMNEKKSKKKLANDTLSNHYMYDDEGENMGKLWQKKTNEIFTIKINIFFEIMNRR